MPPLLAIQFLTRLPISRLIPPLDDAQLQAGLRRSVVWFPAVGGLVGCIGAAVALAGEALWPRAVAVVLLLIVEARLTGAFHEDAVADFCDGMGGGTTPAHVREIMKDSRVGSYGALGQILAVGARAALLIAMPPALFLPAIVASAAFGRWVAVIAMAAIPPPDQGKSLANDVGQRPGATIIAAAGVVTMPFLWLLVLRAPFHLTIACLAIIPFLIWLRSLLLHRLGGVTGDCLGFAVYVGQLILLLCVAARWPVG